MRIKILIAICWCGFAAILTYVVTSNSHYAVSAHCAFVQPFNIEKTVGERMYCCSNVEQRIQFALSSNVVVESTDYPGWEVITNVDKKKGGVLIVSLSKDRDNVLYYPRANGSGSNVIVSEYNTSGARFLSKLNGSGGGWSPVGMLRRVDLLCTEYGYETKVFDLSLEIRISGPNAQVWIKDGKVFF